MGREHSRYPAEKRASNRTDRQGRSGGGEYVEGSSQPVESEHSRFSPGQENRVVDVLRDPETLTSEYYYYPGEAEPYPSASSYEQKREYASMQTHTLYASETSHTSIDNFADEFASRATLNDPWEKAGKGKSREKTREEKIQDGKIQDELVNAFWEASTRDLKGKYQKLDKRIDRTYDCYAYAFYNGKSGKKFPVSTDLVEKYTQHWASKAQFHDDETYYALLFEAMARDKGKYKDHYVAVYRVEGRPDHVSPIDKVYQKKDDSYAIRLHGKWGKWGHKVKHDIEDVPGLYKDNGITNWEIRYVDRKNGRRMDL